MNRSTVVYVIWPYTIPRTGTQLGVLQTTYASLPYSLDVPPYYLLSSTHHGRLPRGSRYRWITTLYMYTWSVAILDTLNVFCMLQSVGIGYQQYYMYTRILYALTIRHQQHTTCYCIRWTCPLPLHHALHVLAVDHRSWGCP